MKRKMLAWILAAAMTATSGPGNLVTAFAEDASYAVDDEYQIVSDEPEAPESDAGLEAAPAGETAPEAGDLIEGQDSDEAGTLQDGIRLDETETETEAASETTAAATEAASETAAPATEAASETAAPATEASSGTEKTTETAAAEATTETAEIGLAETAADDEADIVVSDDETAATEAGTLDSALADEEKTISRLELSNISTSRLELDDTYNVSFGESAKVVYSDGTSEPLSFRKQSENAEDGNPTMGLSASVNGATVKLMWIKEPTNPDSATMQMPADSEHLAQSGEYMVRLDYTHTDQETNQSETISSAEATFTVTNIPADALKLSAGGQVSYTVPAAVSNGNGSTTEGDTYILLDTSKSGIYTLSSDPYTSSYMYQVPGDRAITSEYVYLYQNGTKVSLDGSVDTVVRISNGDTTEKSGTISLTSLTDKLVSARETAEEVKVWETKKLTSEEEGPVEAIYKFKAPSAGYYRFFGSGLSGQAYTYDGTSEAGGYAGFTAEADQTYLILVKGNSYYQGWNGTFTICVNPKSITADGVTISRLEQKLNDKVKSSAQIVYEDGTTSPVRFSSSETDYQDGKYTKRYFDGQDEYGTSVTVYYKTTDASGNEIESKDFDVTSDGVISSGTYPVRLKGSYYDSEDQESKEFSADTTLTVTDIPSIDASSQVKDGESVSYSVTGEGYKTNYSYIQLLPQEEGYYRIKLQSNSGSPFVNLYTVTADTIANSNFSNSLEVKMSSGASYVLAVSTYGRYTAEGTVSLESINAKLREAKKETLEEIKAWETKTITNKPEGSFDAFFTFTPDQTLVYTASAYATVNFYRFDTLERVQPAADGSSSVQLTAGTKYLVDAVGYSYGESYQNSLMIKTLPKSIQMGDLSLSKLEQSISGNFFNGQIKVVYEDGHETAVRGWKYSTTENDQKVMRIELTDDTNMRISFGVPSTEGQYLHGFPVGEDGLIPEGSYEVRASVSKEGTAGPVTEDSTLTVTQLPENAVALDADGKAAVTVEYGTTGYVTFTVPAEDNYRSRIQSTSVYSPGYSLYSCMDSQSGFKHVDMGNNTSLTPGTYALALYYRGDPDQKKFPVDYSVFFRSQTAMLTDGIKTAQKVSEGDTVSVQWDANEEVPYRYFTFTPAEDGQFDLSLDGSGASTNLFLAEKKADGTYTFTESTDPEDADDSRRGYSLKKGRQYLIEIARPYSLRSKDVCLLTVNRLYGAASLDLKFTGNKTGTPEFIEGFNAYSIPFSQIGKLDASVTYAGTNKVDTFQDITYGIDTDNGQSYSLIAGDGFKDGQLTNQSDHISVLPAGNYYAVLAAYDRKKGEYTYLPKTAQTGAWTPSLTTVSTVPFKVISRKEAAARNKFDGASVTADPQGTYYVGIALTPKSSGVYEFTSDLALADVVLYQAAADETGTDYRKDVAVRESNIFRAALDADETYYLFVKPYRTEKFTITSANALLVTNAKVTSLIGSNLKDPLDMIGATYFGVDLTYDDGSTLHLSADEKDAYGNSFTYSLEGDGYYSFYGNEDREISAGSYNVSARSTSGTYIVTSDGESVTPGYIRTGNTVLVKADSAVSDAPQIREGQVMTKAAGKGVIYKFVPDEDGYYSILKNGLYGGGGFYTRDEDGYLNGVWQGVTFGAMTWLTAGETYYVDEGPDEKLRYVAVTKRLPDQTNLAGKTFTFGDEAATELFEVTEDGTYELYEKADPGYVYRYPDVYAVERDKATAVPVTNRHYYDGYKVECNLKKGVTYMALVYAGEDEEDGQLSVQLRIGAPQKEEEPTTEKEDEISAEIVVAPEVDYPAVFAEFEPQDYMKISETVNGETKQLELNQRSDRTGRVYSLEYAQGSSKQYRILYMDETGGKAVRFTGDISGAPALAPGQTVKASTGLRKLNTWFFKFTPSKTGRYHLRFDSMSKNASWDVRNEDGEYYGSKYYAGKTYYIAVHDTEADIANDQFEMVSCEDVKSIQITQTPSSVLRQDLNDREGYEITVNYENGESTVYSGAAYSDEYGNIIILRGGLVPAKKGEDPKARITVTAGGRRTSVDLPLRDTMALPELSVGSAQAATVSDGEIGVDRWYRFTAAKDTVYSFESNLTRGEWYSVEYFEADNGIRRYLPARMEKGKTYLVHIRYSLNDIHAVKAWIDEHDDETYGAAKATLSYQFKAADASLTLPDSVKAVLPKSAVYMKKSQLKPEQPSKLSVEDTVRNGVWVFDGYQSETVKLDQDTTAVGTWSFRQTPSHLVRFSYKVKEGSAVPVDAAEALDQAAAGAKLPADATYYEGQNVALEKPEVDTIETTHGKWTFSKYSNPKFVMGKEDVTVDSFWTYEEEKYQATYEFRSADPAVELSEAVQAYLPDPEEVRKGDKFKAQDPDETTVETEHGNWTFTGYTIDSENHIAVGLWKYADEKFDLTYQFVSGTNGKMLPQSVTALLPAKETAVKGSIYDLKQPLKKNVDVTGGKWTFKGFTYIENDEEIAAPSAKVAGSMVFTGTWEFVTKQNTETAAEVAEEYEKLEKDGSTTPQDALDKLGVDGKDTGASSSDVLQGMEAQVGGNDPADTATALAGMTSGSDDAIVGTDESGNPAGETKKIKDPAAADNAAGAYVGPTVPGEVKTPAGEVKVDASGAAVTAADEILKDSKEERLKDNSVYQAVIEITNPSESKDKEKKTKDLEFDISMKIRVDGDSETELKTEPVRPVSLTITLPKSYQGFELQIFHKDQEVKFAFSSDGTKVTFTVADLSPFTIRALQCKPDAHVMTQHGEDRAATCTLDGMQAFYECSRCGRFYKKGADGKYQEITEEQTKDAETLKINKLGHDLKRVAEVPATEFRTGVKAYYECTRGDGKFWDAAGTTEIQDEADLTIPMIGHNLVLVPAVAATTTTEGCAAYYHCSNCGRNYADAAGTQEITDLASLKTGKLTPQTEAAPAQTEAAPAQTEAAPAEKITIKKKPAGVKAKLSGKKTTVTWKKIKNTKKNKALLKQIRKVEIQYSTDRTFKTGVKTKRVGGKKVKATLRLAQKGTWFIRVRYSDGKGGYSKWSGVRKVKVK